MTIITTIWIKAVPPTWIKLNSAIERVHLNAVVCCLSIKGGRFRYLRAVSRSSHPLQWINNKACLYYDLKTYVNLIIVKDNSNKFNVIFENTR